MKRRLLALGVILTLLALIPSVVSAEEQALSPKALEIANELNCPICEGQSVRDSNSQLARDMRQIIQQQLDEGRSAEEVRQYFVDRYGVGILREPPKSGFFMTLWWAPVIGLGVGVLVLGTFVTQRRRQRGMSGNVVTSGESSGQGQHDDDLREYEERVLRDLDEGFDSREKV